MQSSLALYSQLHLTAGVNYDSKIMKHQRHIKIRIRLCSVDTYEILFVHDHFDLARDSFADCQ